MRWTSDAAHRALDGSCFMRGASASGSYCQPETVHAENLSRARGLRESSTAMDPKLKKQIAEVKAKRPRIVLDHILQHGRVTTDELKKLYGYNHPPRARQDVIDCGIPLKTTMITGPDGKRMAAYSLPDDAGGEVADRAGRRAFPKALREALVARDGEQCSLCGGRFPARALQVDHRVPYGIAGESDVLDPAEFMLVCGSCNRAKSWSCEHCPNWTAKHIDTCVSCLWASPDSYEHVATEARRRLDLVWEGDEVHEYDQVAGQAKDDATDVRELVKAIVRISLRRDPKC